LHEKEFNGSHFSRGAEGSYFSPRAEETLNGQGRE
jgi:hypothetical protein